MFGIPSVKLGFLNDPQKLAMVTSGLALLASSDPEKVLQAMPNVMMAAAMAKERAKQRAYQRAIQQQQLEMQKERLGLTREQVALQKQKIQQELAVRNALLNAFGVSIPGAIGAPTIAKPSAISGQDTSGSAPSAPEQGVKVSPLPPAGPVADTGANKITQTQTQTHGGGSALVDKFKQLSPLVRLQAAIDPAYRRSVMTKLMFPKNPKFVTLRLPNGGFKTFDVSSPEKANEVRKLIASGAVVTQAKADLVGDPFADKGREYIQKELDELHALESSNRKISSKIENILGSDVYLGVGADIFGKIGRTLRDVFGVGSDIDYDALKSVKDLHSQLVLKSLGGSLGKGVSEGDRQIIERGQIDTGDSRKDIARIFAERKLIETAASKRLAFLRQRMRSGVDYFDAQKEWEEFLRLRDEGKLNEVPEYARPLIPPRITRELVESTAQNILKGVDKRKKRKGGTLLQQVEMLGGEVKRKVEESQKMPAMIVKSEGDEEALRQLNAARKQRGLKPLSMEEFQAAKQKGLVKVR